ILELVDKLHEDRKIPREIILNGIASAIQVASERHFGVEEGVFVSVDPTTGHIVARYGEQELDPETLGRIAAQSAKQMIIQKIREA
ncbi:NusA N-terminal domain-containing protein, partial [Halalkalibacter lacteus]|uniref:NusA N-terminal domain-containing protein n=1 Tax=Halalkalibacter lacteus TaxID=3090663 RepID=UPI002FC843BE